jgi:RNA polymerase sigma-70 factor (ECF subfamily)
MNAPTLGVVMEARPPADHHDDTDRVDPGVADAGRAADAEQLANELDALRPRLLGVAYRLLGSAWDAEDVVAEAAVRWLRVDRSQVREPIAYLTTMVTRLALDVLRSARVRRERYTGEWLPEPVVTGPSTPSPLGPLDTVELRETVSLVTLRMMETLSPPERAVLVLHEAFAVPHAEIADMLDMSEASARQHLFRARRHLEGRIGEASSRAAAADLHDTSFARFLAALERGDLDDVQDYLAADVVAYSDGGGKARAARYPLVGADLVLRFFGGLTRRLPVGDVVTVELNGRTAALLTIGREHLALAVDVDPASGRIREIHSILNPDKLRYVRRQLSP